MKLNQSLPFAYQRRYSVQKTQERKTERSFSLPLSKFCSQFVWDVQNDVTGKASRMASVFAVDKYKTAEAPQWVSDRRREHSRAELRAHRHPPNVDPKSDLKLASRAVKC